MNPSNELVTHTALSLMSFGSLDCCLMWSLYWLRHCRRAKRQAGVREGLFGEWWTEQQKKEKFEWERKMRKAKE